MGEGEEGGFRGAGGVRAVVRGEFGWSGVLGGLGVSGGLCEAVLGELGKY